MMKKNNHSRAGFVMIMTLLVTSFIMILVTYMFTRGMVYVPYIQTMIDREKAKMLALSGIQIGMAQLAKPLTSKEEKKSVTPAGQKDDQKKQKKSDPTTQAKQFLTEFLPKFYQRQTFVLKKAVDGFSGTIDIVLMPEAGKVNLNRIFDFEKQQFKGEKQKSGNWKKILESLFKKIETQTKGKDLFKGLETFLKKRDFPMNDVTQLMTIPAFKVFRGNEFFEPFEKKRGARATKQPVYLTDFFTVDSRTQNIDPWLFSDAWRAALDLTRVKQGETKTIENKLKESLKKFKLTAQWKSDWKPLLQPLYVKELQSLPQGIESILKTRFDPTIFSIRAHGTYGNVTVHLYAIVYRAKRTEKDKTVFDVKLKKLYWL